MRRIAGAVVLALTLLLASCMPVATLSGQITAYEKTLRSEADWLWNNMNYARTHYIPAADWCTEYDFNHQPVELTESVRSKDPDSAYLVDHLNYAATMIDEAHAEWKTYCRGQGGNPTPGMETRLRMAYDSLNMIRVSLAEAAPPPGST